MVMCLEKGADLHMAQLMPLPLTVSCFSKIQVGFTFGYYLLVLPAYRGSPGKRAVKRVCVCVCACVRACVRVRVCVCMLVGNFADDCGLVFVVDWCRRTTVCGSRCWETATTACLDCPSRDPATHAIVSAWDST